MRCLSLAALVLGFAACDDEAPTAPSLSVTCSANPGSGTAPLPVGFLLNVSGAQGAISVRINYGDGSSGTDPAATHVYANPGAYTASFDVQTPTQSALCTATVQVAARPTPSPTPTPPTSTTNRPPDVQFRTTPAPTAGLTFDAVTSVTIAFNMCNSADPDGDDINFRMDFDGDGKFEVDGPTGADCRRSFTYEQTGPVSPTLYTPVMCATDLLPSLSPAHPYQCRSYVVKVFWN
jgi:hypothetical protein